jgi:hypothetical protein
MQGLSILKMVYLCRPNIPSELNMQSDFSFFLTINICIMPTNNHLCADKIMSRIAFVAVSFCVVSISFTSLQAQPVSSIQWRNFGKLSVPRYFFGALPVSQTQVLVMGGYTKPQLSSPQASCELIDVEKRSISPAAAMNLARSEAAFVVMPDSSIVAVSGVSTDGITQTCERYDRTLKRWEVLGFLVQARRQHTAVVLNADEILIVGGLNQNLTTLRSAEIFNVRTKQSRAIANYPHPVNSPASARTLEGSVVVFAGRSGGAGSSRVPFVYRYDTKADRWLEYGRMSEAVQTPQTLELSDGRTIIAGGARNEAPSIFSPRVHLIENGTVQLLTRETPENIKRSWHSVVEWNQDSVLVIGGQSEQLDGQVENDWVNLRTGAVTAAAPLLERRMFFRSVALPFLRDGVNIGRRVVAISGLQELSKEPSGTVEILEAQTIVPTLRPPDADIFFQGCSKAVASFTAQQGDLITSIVLVQAPGTRLGRVPPFGVRLPFLQDLSRVELRFLPQLPARAVQLALLLKPASATVTPPANPTMPESGRVMLIVRTQLGGEQRLEVDLLAN